MSQYQLLCHGDFKIRLVTFFLNTPEGASEEEFIKCGLVSNPDIATAWPRKHVVQALQGLNCITYDNWEICENTSLIQSGQGGNICCTNVRDPD